MQKKLSVAAALVCGLALTAICPAFAQEAATDEKAAAAELAKKLQNPIASLISVPIQNNWDFGYGRENAMRYTANVQPVIPFSISEKWNVVTRTIVPIIYAESPVKGGDDRFGLGDIVQSFFFSPKEPTERGWVWGAGPALLYPSATHETLGGEQFGLGPTAVLLKQQKGWTYGLLANHLWSVAGDGNRDDISATYLQPFVSYTTKKFTTFALNTESTYDWENSQWTVPVVGQVSQLIKIAKQPVQFALAGKVYADKPDGGPDWGLRFTVTLLFPK